MTDKFCIQCIVMDSLIALASQPEVRYSLEAAAVFYALAHPWTSDQLYRLTGIRQPTATLVLAVVYFFFVWWRMRRA